MSVTNDYTDVITKLVESYADKVIKGIYDFGSDKYKKMLINFNTAFKEYLINALKMYSYVKTILYNDAPVFLHDF